MIVISTVAIVGRRRLRMVGNPPVVSAEADLARASALKFSRHGTWEILKYLVSLLSTIQDVAGVVDRLEISSIGLVGLGRISGLEDSRGSGTGVSLLLFLGIVKDVKLEYVNEAPCIYHDVLDAGVRDVGRDHQGIIVVWILTLGLKDDFEIASRMRHQTPGRAAQRGMFESYRDLRWVVDKLALGELRYVGDNCLEHSRYGLDLVGKPLKGLWSYHRDPETKWRRS
ncbi:hypothetical protein GW17_00009219 [Ensete ventricosum]|nr:hypothetical protein GW17_00009219 [Ensete ventricosum]